MIVRTLEEIIGSPTHVKGDVWESRRLLLAGDKMGFSLSDTVIKEGSEQRLHYKHHFEANYCISGRGEVVDVKSGKTFPIAPGTLYALDQHDEHILRATSGELRLVCVFYPALTGQEKHRADGSYAPPAAQGEPLR
ncbi:MAG: ectoine synthase [Rhizobiales bacterium]|nr:ectoine synthase [Hyphomicrobiales bacterium]